MKLLTAVFTISLLALVTCSQVLANHGFDKDKMDSLFSVIVENDKAMGSISIFKGGKEIYQNSFGYADVEKKALPTANTIYRIGSITKTFTAAIIMQLIQEGKLRLDTRLAEYYPELPNANDISIELMLRHRSGLYNFINAEAYKTWMLEPMSQSDLLEIIKDNGTVFSPNERAEYSNTNFVLLSFIAEIIDDMTFSEILKERITTPLNLKNTNYGGKINASNNEALSYKYKGSWQLETETDLSIFLGAGALISTPNELNTFYHALFSGGVVSYESIDQMKTGVDGSGMGLFQVPFYDKENFGHHGAIDGFRSNARYFPKENVSIALTCNAMAMNMNNLMIGILSIYFGMDYEMPVFIPALELKPEELDIYLGVYTGEDFPLEITVSKNNNILTMEATGQPTLELEAYEKHKFRFDDADLKFAFIPEEDKMLFKQGEWERMLTRK